MNPDGKICIIFGYRGQGKTLLAQTLAEKSKRFNVYISPKIENYYNWLSFKSIAEFFKSKESANKIFFNIVTKTDFDRIIKILSNLKNINVFIDEISVYVKAKASEYLTDFITLTRPQGINIILISLRPQSFTPLLISQSDYLICFNDHNRNDIKYLEESYGTNFEDLRSLKKYEFLFYGDFKQLLNCIK